MKIEVEQARQLHCVNCFLSTFSSTASPLRHTANIATVYHHGFPVKPGFIKASAD